MSSSPSRSTTTASKCWPPSAFATAASLVGTQLASPTSPKTKAAITWLPTWSCVQQRDASIGKESRASTPCNPLAK
eukprot:2369117-Prymnesium_polylepis.1